VEKELEGGVWRRPRRIEEGTVPASKKDEGTASASEEEGTAPVEGVQGGTPVRCPAAHWHASLALWVSVNCFFVVACDDMKLVLE